MPKYRLTRRIQCNPRPQQPRRSGEDHSESQFLTPQGGQCPPLQWIFIEILPWPAKLPKEQSIVLLLWGASGKKEFLYLPVLDGVGPGK